MKSCAIVILNYNGAEILPTFLPSVIQGSVSDVWVIDNASTDDSLSILRARFPEVKLVELAENFGFAGGYNQGLKPLSGQYEYYILLNSDVEVSEGWDQALVSWMEDRPNYAAVQPKILSWQDKSKFDYAGAGGGFLDHFGYPYCRGRIWNTIETDLGQYDDSIEVDWTSGACMGIRAAVFEKLGGFDSSFFAHMEEIDLCWRIRHTGHKLGYHGSVVVYHLGGATLSRSSPNKLYLNIRNSLSMLYKNKRIGFWSIYAVKGPIEGLAMIAYFLRGQNAQGKAIYRGYRDFWKSRHSLHRAKRTQRGLKSNGPAGFIFGAYFLFQKKFFSQL
ncbi:glycosyltransferase family 2 protein [Algoriphagus namhaensis]